MPSGIQSIFIKIFEEDLVQRQATCFGSLREVASARSERACPVHGGWAQQRHLPIHSSPWKYTVGYPDGGRWGAARGAEEARDGESGESCTRRLTFNFRKTFCKCVFTVFALTPSCAAISLLVIPCTAQRTTSCSRSVRTSRSRDRGPCSSSIL